MAALVLPIEDPAVTAVSPPPLRPVTRISTSLQQRQIRNCAQLTKSRLGADFWRAKSIGLRLFASIGEMTYS